MSDELFKKVLAILIALVTVIATGIAFLQSDAGNRDDRAGRDATRLAIELVSRRVNGETRVNFDYDEAYQKYVEMGTLALAAENRGDSAGSARYELLQESFLKLSPIMQPPYFDIETGEMDYNRYVADVYLTDVIRMNEQYTAAAAVKDAWDTKANTYIVHLTILAVALFLLGLSATIEVNRPRIIFTVVGLAMAAFATVWAISTYAQPVFDLRQQPEAIEAFVNGSLLIEDEQPEAAVEAFNTAITTVPDYAAAYVARSTAYTNMGSYEAAITDVQQARGLGTESANIVGEQAWLEYLAGRFDDSIATGRAALEQFPDTADLWIQLDIALALLAKGDIEAAQAEYQQSMTVAIQAVTDARSRNEAISPELWLSLTGASDDLVDLSLIAQSDEGVPPLETLQDPEGIVEAAPQLIDDLRNLAVSLEFYGRPPDEPITAEIETLEFGEPLYDEDENVTGHEVSDEFEYGVTEMDALFNFSGMQDGQDILVKVYINGAEDASWRKLLTWELGAEGSAIIPLAIAYSDTFVIQPNYYFVELYIDGQVAAEGGFTVLEPE
ncbi:MAG: hypothetical protein LCI00_32845 [Chloroflexi bacterium]|nr:hypothetical protein [Chloroflexota bacterium]MCC6895472.1 hypothetical protein [Anaerolineae bacterium]